MHITFENDIGKIVMGGDCSYKWRIIDIDGIGLPSKTPNVVNYAGQDGQKTLGIVSNARPITIKGDVENDGFTMQEFTRAMRIFDKEVVVKIRNGSKERKTNSKLNIFEPGEKNGAARVFVLQLTCDDPFFYDFVNKSVAVFEITDNLIFANGVNSTFTLPMEFTTRKNEAIIQNTGDVKTEPIFYIFNLSGGAGTGTTYGIEIENLTTKQSIILKYSTANKEIVTVSIPERTIKSNKPTDNNNKGNLIKYISDDTYLSDFWLAVGTNHIKVTNHNTGEEVSVVCEYSNKYVEAIN